MKSMTWTCSHFLQFVQRERAASLQTLKAKPHVPGHADLDVASAAIDHVYIHA